MIDKRKNLRSVAVLACLAVMAIFASCGNSAKNMSVAGTDWFSMTMYSNGMVLNELIFLNADEAIYKSRTAIALMMPDTVQYNFHYKKTGKTITMTPSDGGEEWVLELENKKKFKFITTGGIKIAGEINGMAKNESNNK